MTEFSSKYRKARIFNNCNNWEEFAAKEKLEILV